MVVVVQRLHRFEDTFSTVTDPRAVLKAHGGTDGISGAGGGGGGAIADALWQELKPLANPVPPDGVTADKGVGDIDAVPMLKLGGCTRRSRCPATSWARICSTPPPGWTSASWRTRRAILAPRRRRRGGRSGPSSHSGAIHPPRRRQSPAAPVSAFIAATPASSFYAPTAAMPGGDEVRPPLAETPQAKVSR